MSSYEFEYKIEYSLHPTNPNKILVRPLITARHSSPSRAAQPQHIIFVIDKSSSMSAHNAIGLVKQSVLEFIQNAIREIDTFSVITFDANATIVLNNQRKQSQITAPNIINAINQIQTGEGTAIEKGLSLISKDSNVKVLNEHCSIILLTDGANRISINAANEVANLTRRCQNITPRIIPVGIGVGYHPQLLREFGKETGINAVIHIKDANDIKQSFDTCKLLTGERTAPITLSTVLNNKQLSQAIGSLAPNTAGGWVFEFDKNGPEFELFVKINLHNEPRTFKKLLREISINRDVIANYANQLLANLLENPAPSEKIISEVLRLLETEKNDDSVFVKAALMNIKSAIEAARRYDINSMRANVSFSVVSSFVGGAHNIKPPAVAPVMPTNASPKMLPNAKVIQPPAKIKNVVCIVYFDYRRFDTNEIISFIPGADHALYIDESSPAVQQIVREIEKNTSNNPEDIINLVLNKIQQTFPSLPIENRIERVKEISTNPKNRASLIDGVPCISLDTYINNKVGFSYHVTALAALLIAKLERNLGKDANLKRISSVYQCCEKFMVGDGYWEIKGNLCPSWIIYTINNVIYCIDPMNFIVTSGTNELSLRLKTLFDVKYKNETHRSLTIREDFCFNDEAIPAELLGLIDPNDPTNQKFICPFSGRVISTPVRIAGENLDHVFDKWSLIEWHRHLTTNPITGLKCSNIYIPAFDIKQQIIAKATQDFSAVEAAMRADIKWERFDLYLHNITICKLARLIINQRELKPKGFDEIERILDENDITPAEKVIKLQEFVEGKFKVINVEEIKSIELEKIQSILSSTEFTQIDKTNQLELLVADIVKKNADSKQAAAQQEMDKTNMTPATRKFYQALISRTPLGELVECFRETENIKAESSPDSQLQGLRASSSRDTFYAGSIKNAQVADNTGTVILKHY